MKVAIQKYVSYIMFIRDNALKLLWFMLQATWKRRATHHLPTNQEGETMQDTSHDLERHTEIQE